MSFLIKVTLFLALIIFCIPADPDEIARNGNAHRMVGVFDYFGLAQAAYNDATGFCGRNPVACDTGSAVGDVFAAKARTAVRMAEGWLAPARSKTAETAKAGETKPGDSKSAETAKAPARAVPEATGSLAGLKVPLPPKKPQVPAPQPAPIALQNS